MYWGAYPDPSLCDGFVFCWNKSHSQTLQIPHETSLLRVSLIEVLTLGDKPASDLHFNADLYLIPNCFETFLAGTPSLSNSIAISFLSNVILLYGNPYLSDIFVALSPL